MTALSGWENFYVIVGSSAGALIGLQFVVITLIAGMPVIKDAERAGSAFSTPTIVHFGVVLLLSGVLSAPWHAITPAATVWGLLGLTGVVYTAIVTRRLRIQTAYRPVAYDWVFHALLPFAAHTTLAVSALAVGSHPRDALYAVAGAALLLLFIGIHNAWDAVTYHVFVKRDESGRSQ